MVFIATTLLNIPFRELLSSIYGEYPSEFEYTAEGIFRRAVPPMCPRCGARMDHNSYNTYCKRGRGAIKIGRYICPSCEEPYEEERSFWERLKGEFSYV